MTTTDGAGMTSNAWRTPDTFGGTFLTPGHPVLKQLIITIEMQNFALAGLTYLSCSRLLKTHQVTYQAFKPIRPAILRRSDFSRLETTSVILVEKESYSRYNIHSNTVVRES